MPIDPNEVQWDTPAAINPADVQWDEPEAILQTEDTSPYRMLKPANLLGSAIEPIGVLASGAIGLPASGIWGLMVAGAKSLGLTDKEAADAVREAQDLLIYKPKTEGGQYGTQGVTAPLQVLAEGADVGGDVVSLTPMLPSPYIPAEYSGTGAGPGPAAIANTLVQASPVALGARVGSRLQQSPPSRVRTAVTDTVKKIGGGVVNIIEPILGEAGARRGAGRVLNEVAGERAPAVIEALERAPVDPLGIPRTAGEVAVPAGSTEFAALQRIAELKRPSEYADIKQTAEAARQSAVQTIGKTPAELKAAETARTTESAANYRKAFEQTVKRDRNLLAISENPFFKDAMPDALKLAEAKGINPTTNLTEFLHTVKLSLDKQLQKSGDSALSSTEKRAVVQVRGRLIDWLKDKNPAYDAARARHAELSRPINEMEVGQALEGKLRSGLDTERGATFAGAVKESPSLIKKATGDSRYTELSEVLNPSQMQIVDALVENLQNKAALETQTKQGMSAAVDKVGLATPKLASQGFFDPTISFMRGLINRISGKATDKILDSVADIMRDPKETARVMREASPQQRVVIQAILKQRGKVVGAGVGSAVAGAEQQ